MNQLTLSTFGGAVRLRRRAQFVKGYGCALALFVSLTLSSTTRAQLAKAASTSAANNGRVTTSQVLDYWVTHEEKQLIALAEAMPADKYEFAPTEGEFKGVRTFKEQVKHLASDNFILGAAILGEQAPADAGDETGPDSVRTKAEVIAYLKESFTYFHKAVSTINENNELEPTNSSPISPLLAGKANRLGLAMETLMHTYDHYGQLVEYLRMNGVVPPASR